VARLQRPQHGRRKARTAITGPYGSQGATRAVRRQLGRKALTKGQLDRKATWAHYGGKGATRPTGRNKATKPPKITHERRPPGHS
jgi:hypothetical protein